MSKSIEELKAELETTKQTVCKIPEFIAYKKALEEMKTAQAVLEKTAAHIAFRQAKKALDEKEQ